MEHTHGKQMRNRAHGRRGQSGFTIAEAVVAVAVSSICLGAVMLLNAHQLKLVKSTRESNSASFALQERVEELRLTAWANLTDTDKLGKTVFASTPTCATFLGNYKETLRLSPWPADSSIKPMEVSKSATGGYSVVSGSAEMASQKQGRVDYIVTWLGTDRRVRERSYATIISNGGITRVGLNGYGAYSGASNPTGEGTSGGGSDGGSSGGGTTIDPRNNGNGGGNNGNGGGSSGGGSTGNGGGNGNGNGSGNVGGGGGKG